MGTEDARSPGQAQPGNAAPAVRPRRRRWLLALSLPVAGVAIAWAVWRFSTSPAPAGRPENVLLITIDTTRADHLGCFGGTKARTPNLDRLAGAGARFTRCTTCAPTTLPSHASIMTAVYPYVHGARDNGTGRLADANLTLAEALREAECRTQATIASFVLNEQFGVSQGFDVYHDVVPTVTGQPLLAQRSGDEVCDDALAMLQTMAGKRFFLWAHFYDPHYPYESARVGDPNSPLAYADEITFMDAQIGRLLDRLRELGLERKTLVVVVADHGEGLGEHDESQHGHFLYETTVHAPLIFRCPRVIADGVTVAAQVRTIDIAPTILELLGLPAWEHAQGISLVPLLMEGGQDPGLAAYGETFMAHNDYGLSPLRSLSAGGWKYILAPRPELYHLDSDPGETRNLVAEEPERAADMLARLRQLIADAPPPPALEASQAALDAEDIARLASLGYVASPGRFEDPDLTELDQFEPRGGDPKDYAELLVLATRDLPALLASKQHQESEALLRRMLEAMPDAWRQRVELAKVLREQGRMDEALEVIAEAVAREPENWVVRLEYGMFLSRLSRFEEALDQFTIVLERQPNDAMTWTQAAVALSYLGQHERADAHIRRALEIDPRHVRALRAIGLANEDQNRLVEALRYYHEALEIDPSCRECEADRQRVDEKIGW